MLTYQKKKELTKKIKTQFDIVVNLGGYINHKDRNLAVKTHFKGCKNLVNFFRKKNIQLLSKLEVQRNMESKNLQILKI